MYKNKDCARYNRKTGNLLYEYDTEYKSEDIANDFIKMHPEINVIGVGKYCSNSTYKYMIYFEFPKYKNYTSPDAFLLRNQKPICKNDQYKKHREYLRKIVDRDPICYLQGISKGEINPNLQSKQDDFSNAIIMLKNNETDIDELYEKKPVLMARSGKIIKGWQKDEIIRQKRSMTNDSRRNNYKLIPINNYLHNPGKKEFVKGYNSRIVKGIRKKRNSIYALHGDDTSFGKNRLTEKLALIDDVYFWDLFDNGYQPNWDPTKDYKIIVINDLNEPSTVGYTFLEAIANNTPITVKKKYDSEPDFIDPTKITVIITSNEHLYTVYKRKNQNIIDARTKFIHVNEEWFDLINHICDIHGIERTMKDPSSTDTDEYMEENMNNNMDDYENGLDYENEDDTDESKVIDENVRDKVVELENLGRKRKCIDGENENPKVKKRKIDINNEHVDYLSDSTTNKRL